MIGTARIAFAGYVVFAAGVLVTEMVVVASPLFADEADILSWAVSFDIAILLPIAYLVLARRFDRPLVSVIPVFLLCLAAAHAILPGENSGALRPLGYAAIPAEVFVVSVLIHRARRIAREYRAAGRTDGDFVGTFEEALARVIANPRVVAIGVTEASVIRYGLFGWGRRAANEGGRVFTYHVSCGFGGVVGVFAFLILIEAGLLHAILLPRAAPLAWVFTIVSVYGVLFLFADYNAARLRPIVVAGRTLHVRIALRWSVSIQLDDIDDVRATTEGAGRTALKGVLVGTPNVAIRLRRRYVAKGLYGMRKTIDCVALAVDDVPGFVASITPHPDE